MDSNNIISNCMILFHDYCMILIITIFFFVVFMLMISMNNTKYTMNELKSSNFIEMTWTIIPMFFLLSLSIPSFLMMYYLESETKSVLTYKSISHQWYWSYENDDFNTSTQFDSYMLNYNDLKKSDNRLMEVDNSLILPYLTKIRMIITSTDVLHSWALPNMSLKVDAVPSRLNTMNIYSLNPSSIYSQCSEICSINHSFMPIHVEFHKWNVFIGSLF